MNNIDIVVELLRQAYMDSNWDSVLEAIDILQQEDTDHRGGVRQQDAGIDLVHRQHLVSRGLFPWGWVHAVVRER